MSDFCVMDIDILEDISIFLSAVKELFSERVYPCSMEIAANAQKNKSMIEKLQRRYFAEWDSLASGYFAEEYNLKTQIKEVCYFSWTLLNLKKPAEKHDIDSLIEQAVKIYENVKVRSHYSAI